MRGQVYELGKFVVLSSERAADDGIGLSYLFELVLGFFVGKAYFF